MNYKELTNEIKKKDSFLCIGLDSDINKIPSFLLNEDDPVYEFNKQIIDATHNWAVAYKPNTAFYESRGIEGCISFKKTIDYLNKNYPEIFIIADAKRGDIGNTAEQYAKSFFESYSCDAVTIAPYMGRDSVSPFLNFSDKWTVLLALTSNAGSKDFQFNYIAESQEYLYEQVIRKSQNWGTKDNMMYVVGATQTEHIQNIRKIIPEHFLLVPGVGAQGGSLEDVAKYGMNNNCGLLVNSSRGIIFAGNNKDFAKKATEAAQNVQNKMKELLRIYRTC